MSKSSTQKALSEKWFPEGERWEYLEEGTLKFSHSACVCMTCIHFRYTCDHHYNTLLACTAHHRLIPQGAHLTNKCPLWHKNYEDQSELYPKAA